MSGGSYTSFFDQKRDCSSPVAAEIATPEAFPDWGKGAEFRQFQRTRDAVVAGVADVAGGSVSKLPWSAGIEQLTKLSQPTFLAKERWDELVFDAVQVSQVWGATLAALGWSITDIFGCNPEPRAGRLDRDGLVILLRGRKVISITDCLAVICDGKVRHTFRRDHERLGSVPLWLAFSSKAGP